jgi:hypothetical protein
MPSLVSAGFFGKKAENRPRINHVNPELRPVLIRKKGHAGFPARLCFRINYISAPPHQ